MTTPSLPGIRATVHRPMMSIATALAHLPDATEDDILIFIEQQKLPWAWNIASAQAEKREIRILSACVTELSFGREFKGTFDQVIAHILPPAAKGKPWLVLNPQVIAALGCFHTHGMNLLTEGAFRRVPGTSHRSGPNGSPLITRESFIEFLKSHQEPEWARESAVLSLKKSTADKRR